jgi:hypothetical protein
VVWRASVDTRSLRRAIERVPGALFRELKVEFRGILIDFQREHGKRFLKGRPGLKRITGTLARSFLFRVEGTRVEDLVGIYFTNLVYAKVHEGKDGKPTVIRARNRKFLTIPLPDAKTAGGDVRGPARSFPNTYLGRSKGGNLVIYQKRGKGPPAALFLLKREVSIPPRLNLLAFWNDRQRLHVARIDAAVRRALDSATR